jgi:hypothetical protein
VLLLYLQQITLWKSNSGEVGLYPWNLMISQEKYDFKISTSEFGFRKTDGILFYMEDLKDDCQGGQIEQASTLSFPGNRSIEG